MSRQYFGTDGIRGKVGETPITPDFMLKLGYAAGQVLAADADAIHKGKQAGKPTVLIGKDTRISGYMLESALEAGFAAAGCDVLLVGPMPTPGVAFLTRALRLSAGVMISASHNPFDDNGIKFFSGDGMKLPDAVEAAIEKAIEAPLDCKPSISLGKARRMDDAAGRYLEFCKSTFPNALNLNGMKIVVDCANGAAYDIAPKLFYELGAEVIAIGDRPDGLNINAGVGATHTKAMSAKVVEVGADMGIALDGDADRLMMCDASGRVFDGDQLLYAVVKDRHTNAQLKGGVAGTLMTNFAFEKKLAAMGVPFARAKVGDRYVLEMLIERGWECGGENSGHILCLDKHTTGDGMISALQVLAALARNNTSLADYVTDLVMYPQVLINIRTESKFDFGASSAVKRAVADAESALAGTGRVLLRASGTEPLIRVMVEGENRAQVETLARQIADVVEAESKK
ncbi:MAG: phosphoglucosamine mutase [Burkholderiales bacterium]|jgi:phosphoglucosamine mutase